jgi:hypothetical protein
MIVSVVAVTINNGSASPVPGLLEVVNWSRDAIRIPAQNVSHDQSLSCLCTLLRSAATPLGSNLQQGSLSILTQQYHFCDGVTR